MNLNLVCDVVREISNNLLIKLFSEKQQIVARTRVLSQLTRFVRVPLAPKKNFGNKICNENYSSIY